MTFDGKFLARLVTSKIFFSSSFMPPKRTTLRRIKLEELIFKMQQIEEQAALTLQEYPHGHTVERQRLVIAIAKQVRSHLLDQAAAGERKPVVAETAKLGVIDGHADRVRVAVFPERSSTSAEKVTR
jgi:hypothetical protein